MAKFRSYFASNLDLLKSSISNLLALNAESSVDEDSFKRFFEYLEGVYSLSSNRDFNDLIRKK